MMPLFASHWQELAPNRNKVRFSPRWDVYEGLEKTGVLLLVTLRQDGVLVGYFVGFVQPALHCRECIECVLDMLWTHPDVRGGSGLLTPGLTLLRAVRRELKARSVDRWHVGSLWAKDASRLFRALGMTPLETYYSEWIGA